MKKLMVMVAAMAMLASSAYAADWNFYGSARVATFYSSVDVINNGADSADNYTQALQGNSRIGATVKVSDELTGGFEYGTGVNVRKLYGEWNFGAGSLLVGQTYTPLNWFYSDQVGVGGDMDLLAYGGVYSAREAMLRLKFGGLQIAVVPVNQLTTGVATTSTEVTIPAIELAYNLALDNVSMNFGAGYQTFEATLAGGNSEDVDSYVLAFGAKAGFGAFYLAGNIYAGQNVGNIIIVDTDGVVVWNNDNGVANLNATTIDDNDVLGGLIVAGFTLNDMFNFEAGYGFAEEELDVAGSTSDKVSSYYLNATVTLAPGVFFVPEIGVVDGDEAGDIETEYFGIKWQINF